MGRIEKLKRDHIKKVNKLLDENFITKEVKKKEVPLQPSENVQNANSSFIDKMNKLL
jgi:hypothetical protein